MQPKTFLRRHITYDEGEEEDEESSEEEDDLESLLRRFADSNLELQVRWMPCMLCFQCSFL